MRDVLTWPVGRAQGKASSSWVGAPPLGPPLAYAAGTTVAGTFTGFMLSALGNGLALGGDSAISQILTMLMLLLATLAAVLQLTPTTSALLPPRHRQVPRAWLGWNHRSATAAAWGLLIGAGFWTSLRYSALYVLAIALMFASIETGAVVGAIYGAGRGAALLMTWTGDRLLGKRLDWEGIASNQSLCIGLTFASAGVLGLLAASGPY